MNKRFLLILSSLFIFMSCSQYIDLGGDKSMAYDAANEDTEWDTDSEAYDSADKSDTGYDYGDNGDSDAGSESYDEGSADSGDNNGASYEENDSCEEADDSDYSESADTDFDNSDTGFDNSDTDSDDSGDETDSGSGEDGIFPEDFSNEECDCGDEPGYHPICCDGKTLVFNACFANCYAVNSNGRICAFYEIGLCSDETDDSETDDSEDDGEQPDSDEDSSEISNECGCYPDERPELFACMQDDNVTFFMSSCLAECHCDDPKKVIE
ncbi:hypothetical protein J6Z19_02260 [bacterium]|nr:hypothetical protein [bacterium]